MHPSPPVAIAHDAEGVVLLTLANPPLNLNTLETIRVLQEHCAALVEDDRARVVVVTGEGSRAFCAGSDLNEFTQVRDAVVEKKLRNENAAFSAIAGLPQPVIAAINGTALGGGAEIALACDLRVMDESAVIGFPEVRLGVFPGSGGVFRLPRLVGTGAALRLLYTGAAISASEAYRLGLVDEVAPAGAALSAALRLARELAAGPSLALSLIKRRVYGSFHETPEQAVENTLTDSDLAFTGPDLDEGLGAFFGKREPRFTAGRSDARGEVSH